MKCKICKAEAVVSLRSHNAAFCPDCYREFFRRQVRKGIESQKMFTPDMPVLVAISGGKDSLALLLELSEMGYNAAGLFIDLAIPGSSETAREKVSSFCDLHHLPLRILDMRGEGLPIPAVKKLIRRPICSVCGKIKRYYFNWAAVQGGFAALATGHNLDDETARLASNTLRWDMDYLAAQGPNLPGRRGFAAKVKPLWRLTEFEIANYAFLRGIDYHCAACPYSEGASFSMLKKWMQILEERMPGRKIDFYQGFLSRAQTGLRQMRPESDRGLHDCEACGMPTSSLGLCGVCRIKMAVANGQP